MRHQVSSQVSTQNDQVMQQQHPLAFNIRQYQTLGSQPTKVPEQPTNNLKGGIIASFKRAKSGIKSNQADTEVRNNILQRLQSYNVTNVSSHNMNNTMCTMDSRAAFDKQRLSTM